MGTEIANSPMTEMEVRIQHLNDQIDRALVIRNIAQSLHDKVFGMSPLGEDKAKSCKDYSNGVLGTLQLKLDQLQQLQSESEVLLNQLTKGI